MTADAPADLPVGLAAPARRALAGAGIETLADLAGRSRADIAALHGMGPNALAKLDGALAAAGLAYSAPL